MTKDPYLDRYTAAFNKAKNEVKGQSARWKGVTCPEQEDEPCRLCQLARAILKKQDSFSAEMVEYAYELAQKTKVYMNVILRDDPKKVVVLECGKMILNDLMDAQMGMDDPEVKDFFALKTGRNVLVIKKGSGRSTKYKVRFKGPSAIGPKVMEQVYDLENLDRYEKVPIIRPSQFEQGSNEMRILPNWRFGEDVELFFFTVKHHMGLTEGEFNAVQSGKFNPFSNEVIPNEEKVETFNDDDDDVPMFADDDDNDDNPFANDDEGDDDDEGKLDETHTDDDGGTRGFSGTGEPVQNDDEADDYLKRSPCFQSVEYDPDDEECQDCPDFKECGMKRKKKRQ